MLDASDTSKPFAVWDAARRKLDDAIRLYLDASAALAASVLQPSNLFSDQEYFEAAVNTVRYDVDSFNSRHKDLEDARFYLCKIQNRSSVHIPFNKLPLEIITRIFHTATGRSCACDRISDTLYPVSPHDYGPKTLLTLTHVCSHWRDIAIYTPPLWSHVTFSLHRADDFNEGLGCPQTWLTRARNTTLYIHLDGEPRSHTGRQIPGSVTRRLLPYIKRIVGLSFGVGWTYPMTRWLLSQLLAGGEADLLQDFVHLGGSTPWGNQPLLLAPPHNLSEPLESPLPSLRIVNTSDMCFSWESSIYRNLVTLRLIGLSEICTPTIKQLLGALSACPELRVLDLRYICFEEQDLPQLAPVTLGTLELLDITYMWPDSIPMILPFISSGENELSIRMECQSGVDRQQIQAIVSFLERSRVTKLFMLQSHPPYLSEILTALPDLRVLILDFDSGRGDMSLNDITYLAHPDAGRRSALCPKLESLYLINGALENGTVEAAVEAHSLKRLTFGACFLDPFEEVLVHWLKPMVEDVLCIKDLNPDLDMNWNMYMV